MTWTAAHYSTDTGAFLESPVNNLTPLCFIDSYVHMMPYLAVRIPIRVGREVKNISQFVIRKKKMFAKVPEIKPFVFSKGGVVIQRMIKVEAINKKYRTSLHINLSIKKPRVQTRNRVRDRRGAIGTEPYGVY